MPRKAIIPLRHQRLPGMKAYEIILEMTGNLLWNFFSKNRFGKPFKYWKCQSNRTLHLFRQIISISNHRAEICFQTSSLNSIPDIFFSQAQLTLTYSKTFLHLVYTYHFLRDLYILFWTPPPTKKMNQHVFLVTPHSIWTNSDFYICKS